MPDPEFDDIDAVFVRTGMVDPPNDLISRVMLMAKSEGAIGQPASRGAPILWTIAYLLALLGLAVLAYGLGMAFANDGTSSLLAALTSDTTLLSDAPTAYVEAFLSSLPWVHLGAVLLDLALLGAITWFAIRFAASGRSGWRISATA
jgi:hypothetical protein